MSLIHKQKKRLPCTRSARESADTALRDSSVGAFCSFSPSTLSSLLFQYTVEIVARHCAGVVELNIVKQKNKKPPDTKLMFNPVPSASYRRA